MSGQRVQDHYARSGSGGAMAARIIAALRAHAGADVAITPETLAPIDHLHGRGELATQELIALLEPQPGEAILDIGSGLGGPARWIAAKFGCEVTGVDLTTEHCDAARELNAACGLSSRVRILEGSALALPLPNASFDRAYSHNVVMNIADKAAVYREAFRVVKPGGRLVLLHVNAGPYAPVEFFPVGWASVPENSFLATHEETRHDIAAAGFNILTFREMAVSVEAAAAARRKLAAEGLPPLGPHVVRAGDGLQMQVNSMRAREDGRVCEVQIVARKPDRQGSTG
jgi:sarcosine/dimethylglycine N-methyltransferase